MPDDHSKTNVQKDYYYILGVRPSATREEIQEAYDELYEKFGPHVSVQGMDPDAMMNSYKAISEAFEILINPNKRKEYDKASGSMRSRSQELRSLLIKQGGDEKEIQALPLELEMEISLKEAIKGSHKQIKIVDPKPCQDCAGLKPVSRLKCPNCKGVGYSNIERTEEIDLPAGLFDNMEIRKSAQGRYDMRVGRNGDLIIKIKLRPHQFLNVLGRDITCTVPISIYEAMLGSDVEVPSATGRVRMKIQPLTQPGRVYRLKGLGLAGADQLVTIEVVLPQHLSGEEISLFKKLKEMSREPDPRESIFSRL